MAYIVTQSRKGYTFVAAIFITKYDANAWKDSQECFSSYSFNVYGKDLGVFFDSLEADIEAGFLCDE